MAWITNRELVARGVPQSAIDRAVADRRLKGTRLTNQEMAFNCDAVDSWLADRPDGVAGLSNARESLARFRQEEEATVRREQSARAATSATPSAISSASAQATNPPSDPISTFNSLLAHLMKEGRTQAEATREIFRTDPGLQAKYVEATQRKQQRENDYKELDAMRGREARGYGKPI